MNHSHARTAVRRSRRRLRRGRPARIRSAVAPRTALHEVAHLGRAAPRTSLRVGLAALLDPAEEGVELLGAAARRRVDAPRASSAAPSRERRR